MDIIKLHLFGKDDEDYNVLSSLIQDAAVPISEMKFELIRKQFIIVCSRYVWENKVRKKESMRVVSGVCFDNVLKVKKKNFPQKNSQHVLNFLTARRKENYVELIFSGEIIIKLEGNMISFRIDDLNKEWPTIFSPSHNLN